MLRWISTAHLTASTTLANSTNAPSPMSLTFVGVLTKRDAVGLEAPDAAVMGPGDALERQVFEGRAR